jgi:hypothetical protein
MQKSSPKSLYKSEKNSSLVPTQPKLTRAQLNEAPNGQPHEEMYLRSKTMDEKKSTITWNNQRRKKHVSISDEKRSILLHNVLVKGMKIKKVKFLFKSIV